MSEIRRLRKSLDITQTELSKESGISQSTIAKIERERISASYETVVALFGALERMRQTNMQDMRAIDAASKKVITIQSNEKVHSATELMRSTGFSQLPVLSGDVPVGSISERSIFNLLRAGRTMDELKDTVVSAIMEESFPLVNENTPLSSVTSIMTDCDAVLVFRKGKVVGMITDTDLLKLI
ncbi:MAG: CBS domain-containing protein [Methanomassiliicoccaceae archaeon]|nr:CBS domain-containing protein [Methanomassiliicoccaceae archaeon]